MPINTGELIKKMRITAYLTQEQLGGKMGCTKAAISQLETREDCKISSLHEVAKACGYQLEINLKEVAARVNDITITI